MAGSPDAAKRHPATWGFCTCGLLNPEEALILALARAEELEDALRQIAAPKRPDGTYNLSREACDDADLAKLLGAGAPYRRCSEPELYGYEVTSTHPDAVALACELAEVPRA